MKLVMIAAIGRNNELGKNNDLIWHLPKDLKFFSQQTKGAKMVMGRKTFDSLPGMLPGRHHIVISRSNPDLPKEVEVFSSVEDFMNAYQQNDETIFCIGGAQMYANMLPYADTLVLTEIDDSCDADVYFPMFNKDEYTRTSIGKENENGLCYEWVRYDKK